MNFTKIKALLEIASKDKSRPVLNTVHFFEGVAESTDGYILMRMPFNEVFAPNQHVKVDRSKLEKAVREAQDIQINETTVVSSDVAISYESVLGDFPPTQRIVPDKSPKASVVLSVRCLESLCNAMKKAGVERFKLGIHEELKPVEVVFKLSDTSGEYGFAMVMPFKDEQLLTKEVKDEKSFNQ